jgi:hypothetical protein
MEFKAFVVLAFESDCIANARMTLIQMALEKEIKRVEAE